MSGGPRLTVAIQGERGAFSHEAAHEVVGPDVEILACASFESLFDAAVSGKADRALVPIENQTVPVAMNASPRTIPNRKSPISVGAATIGWPSCAALAARLYRPAPGWNPVK